MKHLTGIIAFVLVLLLMPIGHIIMSFFTANFSLDYQILFAGLLGIIGFVIILVSSRSDNEIKTSLLGLIAGIFIWTGWVEFSFVYFAERLQIKPLMDGSEVITRPEYLVMISSLGLVLSVLSVAIVNNATRCNMFMWFQRVFRLKITKVASKKNYVALTAFETIMLIWFFYIVLLVVYDDHLFGDRHPATYIVFFLSLLWSFFLFRNLLRKKHLGKAIRYAIPTVVIFWNAVEILGRWNFFSEFWVEPNKYSTESIIIILCFVALFVKAYIDRHRMRVRHN